MAEQDREQVVPEEDDFLADNVEEDEGEGEGEEAEEIVEQTTEEPAPARASSGYTPKQYLQLILLFSMVVVPCVSFFMDLRTSSSSRYEIDSLVQKLKKNPSAEGYFELSELYMEANKHKQMYDALNEAVRLNSSHTAALTNRAILMADSNNRFVAERDFDKVVKLHPKLGSAYFNRGVYHDGNQHYDKAVADYTRAIQLGAGAAAFNNRGMAHSDLRQFDDALADVQEAMRLEPLNGYFVRNRAYIYQDQKEWLLALGDLQRAQQLSPSLGLRTEISRLQKAIDSGRV